MYEIQSFYQLRCAFLFRQFNRFILQIHLFYQSINYPTNFQSLPSFSPISPIVSFINNLMNIHALLGGNLLLNNLATNCNYLII